MKIRVIVIIGGAALLIAVVVVLALRERWQPVPPLEVPVAVPTDKSPVSYWRSIPDENKAACRSNIVERARLAEAEAHTVFGD